MVIDVGPLIVGVPVIEIKFGACIMYGSRNVNCELFEEVPSKAKVVPLTLAVITRSFPSSTEVTTALTASSSLRFARTLVAVKACVVELVIV